VLGQGFDVLGERLRALAVRRRAGSRERRRALRIIERAGELATLGERALTSSIDEARAATARHRDDPRATDEAFAVCCEVVRREIGLSLHPEQVMGALAMAEGRCAEMATGEGKTVTAILPAALDGWVGRGAHVITVNDYLARRDAEITGPA